MRNWRQRAGLAAVVALCAIALLGLGCTTNSTAGGRPATPGAFGAPQCVLWDDPMKIGVTLPDNDQARARLETWVTEHGKRQPGVLSQPAGVKPMFRLLYVTATGQIRDEVPIYSGTGKPGAKPFLTAADHASLRACFAGGKPASVDLVTRTAAIR